MVESPSIEVLIGTVDHIVYAEPDSGFTVARFHVQGKNTPVVIIGVMPSLQPGESLRCRGEWKKHAQHGQQFAVASFEACIPSDIVGIQKYLESGMIKGIGPIYAKKIVDKFGLNTLKIIDANPDRLSEVEGIGTKRLEQILSCWHEQRSIREVMVFLRGHQIGAAYSQKIYKKYKEKSIERVQENPYSLSLEFPGIGFKTADKIAQSLGIAKHSATRIDAGVEHLLRERSNEGHTCFPVQEFLTEGAILLEISSDLLQERIQALVLDKRIIEEEGRLWLNFFYRAEQKIAQEISRILGSTSFLRSVDSAKALDWVQEKLRLRLAEEQKEAVLEALVQKMLIITGGPGTGKSTITKAILRIYEKITSKILLGAPTGRAAKRLGEITYKKAFTIHSLLEVDFLTKQFKRNQHNPLICDLLIIDEASMIDTQLLYYLLQAIPHHARVIIIGDVDQLPSVGAGNILRDLIASGRMPVVSLQKIFRQAALSRIVTNAHRVNKGYMPDTALIPGSDFLFLDKETPEEILQELLHQVQVLQPSYPGKIQLLSPMKKGMLGTENLNALLQNLLNPSPTPLLKMGHRLHLQDKVMQIRNNYQKEIFNGDIGFITAIDLDGQQIEVSFEGKPCIYDFTELDELVLAYAVSIHKYQGSECDCILLPMHTSHFKLLSKNLLYTGITRGKKLVVLVGNKKAIAIAVHKAEASQRHTGLKEQFAKMQSMPSLGTK